MERLVREVLNLRQKCHRYGDDIDSILGKPTIPDPRSRCFAEMFNYATLTVELLSYYYSQWRSIHIRATEEDLKRSKEENAERCKTITKMQFILSISSIEHNAKESILLCQKTPLVRWYRRQQQQKRRIYLSGIMKKSNQIGMVSNKDLESWDCILGVRNSVVHNNAIADQDKTYQIDGMTVSFVNGKMLRGKLGFFVQLTDKAAELYYSWVQKLTQ